MWYWRLERQQCLFNGKEKGGEFESDVIVWAKKCSSKLRHSGTDHFHNTNIVVLFKRQHHKCTHHNWPNITQTNQISVLLKCWKKRVRSTVFWNSPYGTLDEMCRIFKASSQSRKRKRYEAIPATVGVVLAHRHSMSGGGVEPFPYQQQYCWTSLGVPQIEITQGVSGLTTAGF